MARPLLMQCSMMMRTTGTAAVCLMYAVMSWMLGCSSGSPSADTGVDAGNDAVGRDDGGNHDGGGADGSSAQDGAVDGGPSADAAEAGAGDGGDQACAALTGQGACIGCCASNHPQGGQFFGPLAQRCECGGDAGAGPCASECASTFCNNGGAPDTTCLSCMDQSFSGAGACKNPIVDGCNADPNCMVFWDCVTSAGCLNKPTSM
jgi:hypothetical protein